MGNDVEILKISPLSPMQQGMFLHYLKNKGDSAYFEQSTFTIKGDLNLELLEKSFNELIKRHEVFRTVFVNEGVDEPIQVVLNESNITLQYENILSLSEEEKSRYIEEFEIKDRSLGFDLTRAPLTRLAVIKTEDNAYKVIWSFHHIIMDGWCMGIVIDDLMKIYNSLNKGCEVSLDKVCQYSDYIKWLEEQNEEEALNFWSSYLDEYRQKATLPKIAGYSDENVYSLSERVFTIDENLTSRLQSLAKDCRATLNIVIQSMWALLLKKYNNTDDVVFGSVVSGRPSDIEDSERIVGLFINTVPTRIRFDEGKSFSCIVKEAQDAFLEVKKYEYCSLSKIESSAGFNNDCIDHILAFENYPAYDEINNRNIEAKGGLCISEAKSFEQTNYDFNVIVVPGKELLVRFSYNSNVYDRMTVENIEGHLRTIISQVLNNPDLPVSQINILTDKEKRQILLDFNNTKTEYPHKSTIIELFEKQVSETPEKTAVVHNGIEFTYQELNRKANQLASFLRQKGIKPNEVIALMSERSIDFIVAILGILKSGAAFMPVDPEYPSDRLKYLMEDSNAKMILVQDKFTSNISFDIDVANLGMQECYLGKGENLLNVNVFSDIAYVMYTSGSTGTPKGVMVEHKNVIRLVKNNSFIKGSTGESILLTGAVMFDAITFEIWWPLLNGYKLYIADQNVILDARRLGEKLLENKITTLWLTSSLFNQLCQRNIDMFKGLRNLLVGGDVLSPKHINSVKKKFPTINIINGYGPTENTTFSTCFTIDREYDENIPIGKPISNSTAYIVDKDGNLQPVGAIGELWVGGDGVARGYLNNPDLSSRKFIDSPFITGERVYKTGDLARWMPDGTIEFLGRIDNQVKIRGFRIELGEIETHLSNYHGIKEAAIILEDYDNVKCLCAYFVTDIDIKVQSLRGYLSEKLPAYMVPSYYTQIKEMPLTRNGKIDRKMLSEIEVDKSTVENYKACNTETEKKLAHIWSSLLGTEKISVNDKFFDIGGNSILVMSMHSKIEEIYPGKVSIADIFACPTISKLAGLIDEKEKKNAKCIDVKRLAIPQSYFCNGDEDNIVSEFEYRLEGKALDKLYDIAQKNKVDAETVLLGINAFLFNRISNQKEISIQTMIKAEGEVFSLNIDFSNISDFSSLFKAVAAAFSENYSENAYLLCDAADFICLTGEENRSIVPFFMLNKLENSDNNLAKIYEIVIGVRKDNDYIEINCCYKRSILSHEGVEELFNAYVKAINMVIDKF